MVNRSYGHETLKTTVALPRLSPRGIISSIKAFLVNKRCSLTACVWQYSGMKITSPVSNTLNKNGVRHLVQNDVWKVASEELNPQFEAKSATPDVRLHWQAGRNRCVQVKASLNSTFYHESRCNFQKGEGVG